MSTALMTQRYFTWCLQVASTRRCAAPCTPRLLAPRSPAAAFLFRLQSVNLPSLTSPISHPHASSIPPHSVPPHAISARPWPQPPSGSVSGRKSSFPAPPADGIQARQLSHAHTWCVGLRRKVCADDRTLGVWSAGVQRGIISGIISARQLDFPPGTWG